MRNKNASMKKNVLRLIFRIFTEYVMPLTIKNNLSCIWNYEKLLIKKPIKILK